MKLNQMSMEPRASCLLPRASSKKDMVWYASYGSNLYRERFLCYICGGSFSGLGRTHEGCRDDALPQQDQMDRFPGRLYFSKHSEIWRGAVAFVDQHDKTSQFLCRRYLITREQFADVYAQENDLPPGRATVDFDAVEKNGTWDSGEGWYSRVVKLGVCDDFPVYTFTASDHEQARCQPSDAYVRVIVSGLTGDMRRRGIKAVAKDIRYSTGFKYQFKNIVKLMRDVLAAEKRNPARTQKRLVCSSDKRVICGHFLIQVPQDVRKQMGLKNGSRIQISRKHGARTFRAQAYVQPRPKDGSEVGVDQTLRVAIGVILGDEVRLEKIVFTFRSWLQLTAERIVKVQSSMLRVQKAAYPDMETNICRIPCQVFDVIAAAPGAVILLESVCPSKTTQGKSSRPRFKMTRARSYVLDQTMCKTRKKEMSAESAKFINPRLALDLKRLSKASAEQDLPPIFMDDDLRERLSVAPGDVVRAVRDPGDTYSSKLGLIALPLVLALVGAGVGLQGIDDWVRILIIATGFALPLVLLLHEVRREIGN